VSAPFFEPPLAASEVEHLLGALHRQRATFRYKCDGLTDDQLRHRLAPSLTLGGLLAHLALVEEYAVEVKIRGRELSPAWVERLGGLDGGEFLWANDQTSTTLYALYDDTVRRVRTDFGDIVTNQGLDAPSAVSGSDGTRASVRRILVDLLEEYGRHTGHADLIRESLDGRVGEDPDPDWPDPFS
jgi:hypothetical protein